MKDEGVDLFLKSNDPTPEGGEKLFFCVFGLNEHDFL